MGKTVINNPYQGIIDLINQSGQRQFDPFDPNVPLASSATIGPARPTGIDITQSEFQVPSSITPEELPYYQASQLDNWQRLGRTVGNLPFNVGYGVIETFGYLGSMPSLLWGGDDFDNNLTKWARERRNKVFGEVYEPVYGDSTIQHITNPAWWIVNGGGLVESISEFGITTIPIAGTLGKAAQLAANVSKATAATATGLNLGARVLTGVTTGYMEGAMSAAQIYEQTYNDALSKGLGFDVAEKNAASAAATTARINTVLMGISNAAMLGPAFFSADKVARAERYAQQMGLNRAVGETNEQFIKRLEALSIDDAMKNNTYKIFGRDTNIRRGSLDWVKESGLESAEELANVFAEQRGLQAGGVVEKKSILETVWDVMSSPEGQMSALLGAFGGIGEASIINRLPWHRYQETKETKDAEGRPITEPVGPKRWVSSKFLEDKEVQDKFEAFKGTVVRDVQQFEEGQQALKNLKTKLINATDDDKQWIETQIELQKQKLFDFSAYASLQTGNIQAVRDLFQGIAEVDNIEILSDKIDQQIAELKATRNTLPEDNKRMVDIEIDRLEKESAKVSGMTAAMAAGLADNQTDNAYKTRAQEQLNKINSLEKIYDDTMARYNYGDELTYGLAKYVFSAKAELLNLGVSVDQLTAYADGLSAQIDSQMATAGLPMDVQTYVKNKSEHDSYVARLTKLQNDYRGIIDDIDSMTETELLGKMHELGVSTSTIPVNATKEMLQQELSDYINTTASEIAADIERTSENIVNAVTQYANSRAITKPLPLGSTATVTPDLEEASKQLMTEYNKQNKSLYALSTVRTRVKNLQSVQTHLNNSINKLSSAKGRKEFIEFVKKQLEDRKKVSDKQRTTTDTRNITERQFANELRMKGYDKDFVNAFMKALTEGTPLPANYRNINVFVQGTRNKFAGKRYRIYIDENGKANISELKPKGAKRSRWELTTGKSVKYTDKKQREVYRNVKDKKTGKMKKVLDKKTELRGTMNIHSFMRAMKVLSVQENTEYNAVNKLRVKRQAARESAFQMIRQFQARQESARAVIALRQADIATIENVISNLQAVVLDTINTFNVISVTGNDIASRIEQASIDYRNTILAIEASNVSDADKTVQAIAAGATFEENINKIIEDLVNAVLQDRGAQIAATNVGMSTNAAQDQAVQELEQFAAANAGRDILTDPTQISRVRSLLDRTSEIHALNLELLGAQQTLRDLTQAIDYAEAYLADLMTLPLTSFNTAPIIELRQAVEGELKENFDLEFEGFMQIVNTMGREEMSMFVFNLYTAVEEMSDADPNKAQMIRALTSLMAKYNITDLDLMNFAPRPNNVIGGIVDPRSQLRVARALQTLSQKGYKIDTLEDLIQAEEILLMRDALEVQRGRLQTEIDALELDLQQLREFRSLQRQNLYFLAKASKNASLFDMAVVDEFKRYLEDNYKDVIVGSPEELLKALALEDTDNIAYKALFAELMKFRNDNRAQVDADIALFTNRFANRHIDSRSVNDLVQDQIDAIVNAKQAMLRSMIKRQALFVTLLNNYIGGMQYDSMFRAIYYKKLKALGSSTDYDWINNYDLDFTEDIESEYYTVERKTKTEYSTTGLEDIFMTTNPAFVDAQGTMVMARGIRGVNKDDGTILDPTVPTERAVIERYLPLERWFSFTAASSTRKMIADGELNLRVQSLSQLLEYVDTTLEDANITSEKKLRFEVLKKELEAMQKSIEQAHPNNYDDVISNTIIAIPVTKTGEVTYAAYFDADINSTQSTIPWTVLRSSNTLFPTNVLGDLETDLDKLKVGAKRVQARERKYKFEIAGNSVTIYTNKEKTEVYKFPNGETTYTLTGTTPNQRSAELQQLRRRVAVAELKAEYDNFIQTIVDEDNPLFVEVKELTPGMNLMVNEITPTGPKLMKRKMSEISLTQDGDFKGELYIVQRNGLSVDGVQYSQFSAGQLVYKGLNDVAYLAMTKNLEDLDVALKDRVIDVFLYSLLLAGTTGAPLGSINVRTQTYKGTTGNKPNRNDEIPSDMIPVFPSKSALSILETFINYGRKRDNGGKFNPNKDQIFIESGNVVMIRRNAAGVYERVEVRLADIIVNGTIDKNNTEVKKIIDYLSKKHLNVNSRMLLFSKSHNMFFLPKVSDRLKSGSIISIGDRHGIEMEFRNENYKTWLAKNVLEVSKLPESKMGQKLTRTSGQKNMVYGTTLSDSFIVKQTKTKQANTNTNNATTNVLTNPVVRNAPATNTPSTGTQFAGTKWEGRIRTSYKNTQSSIPFASLSKDQLDSFKLAIIGYGSTFTNAEIEEFYNTYVYSPGAPKKAATKLSKEANIALLTKAEQSAARENLREIFGDQFVKDNFDIVAGLIYGDSLGYFTDDGRILLSDQSYAGVEYHEAFHRVWRVFVPEGKRADIIQEFKQRANWQALVQAKRDEGYRNKEESELIEEILSDEFMDYMMNKKTKLDETQRNWFQRLIAFLRSLFSADDKHHTKLDRLFSDIAAGKYRNMSGSVSPIFIGRGVSKKVRLPMMDNIAASGVTFRDLDINDTVFREFRNGLSLAVLRALRNSNMLYGAGVQSVDINDIYYRNLSNILFNIVRLNIPEARPMIAYAKSILDIHDMVVDLESLESLSDTDRSKLNNLKKILNNNEIIRGYNAFMKDLGIDTEDNTVTSLTLEQMMDTTNGPIKDDSTYRVTFELDMRTSMNRIMKLLVATLPEVQATSGEVRRIGNRIIADRSGATIIPVGGTILTNIAQPGNWNNTVALLLKEMAGVPSIFVPVKLRSLGVKFPILKELSDYLLKEGNEDALRMFVSSFHNHNYEMSIQMMRIEDSKEVSVYPANANVNSGTGIIQLRMRSYIEQQLNGNETPQSIKDYFNKVSLRGTGTYNQAALTKVLELLGLDIPQVFLTPTTGGAPLFLNSEYVLTSTQATLGATSTKNLQSLAYTLVDEIVNNNRIKTLDDIFNGNIVKGTLNSLTEIASRMTPSKSVSIMNGQNKMYYPVNQHSYQTVLLDDINFVLQASEAEIAEMHQAIFQQEEGGILFDQFEQSEAATKTREVEDKITTRIVNDLRRYNIVSNPVKRMQLKIIYYMNPHIFMTNNNYHSIWKQRILKHTVGSTAPIQIVIKDSLKLDTDRNAQHLSELYATDLFTVIMASGVYGEYKSVQHAERSIYYFYRTQDFIPYSTKLFNQVGQVDTVDRILSDTITSTVIGYLTDELLAYHDRVHNNTNLSGFKDLTKYDGMFNDIIYSSPNSPLARGINALIAALSRPNITHDVAINTIREYLNSNTALREAIMGYVISKSGEFLSVMKNEHRLLLNDTPVFNENALSLQDNKNSTEDLARIFWINTWFSHIEETKMFSGPTQLYGSAGTFWKRMVTQSSTGNLMNTSPNIINLINALNNQTTEEFGIIYGKTEKGLISEVILKEEPVSANEYRHLVEHAQREFYTQLYINLGMSESIAERLANEQAEKYARGYESVNENDGIAYINPFAYRAYMVMSSKWTEEMQEVFDFEMFILQDALRNINRYDNAVRRFIAQGNTEQQAKDLAANMNVYTPIDVLFNRFMRARNKSDISSIKWFHEHAEAMTMLKPQYVGPVYTHKDKTNPSIGDIILDSNIQHMVGGRKMAYDYLSPYVLRGERPSERTKMFNMLTFMINYGIDHIPMGSAAKFGTVEQVSWYDANNQFNSQELIDDRGQLKLNYLSHLDWQYMKNQVDIHTSQERKIVDSSQSRKNKIATIMHNGIPVDFHRIVGESDEDYKQRWDEHLRTATATAKRTGGKLETGSTLYNLKEEYKQIQAELTYRLIAELESSLGYNREQGKYTEDLKKIIDVLKQNAENRNYSSNIIEMIEDLKNTKAYDFLPNRKRIESLLTSLVSREVISQKRLGMDLPQTPSTGLEPMTHIRTAGDEGVLRFYRPNVVENTTSAEVIMPLPQVYMQQVFAYYLDRHMSTGGNKKDFNIFRAVEMLNADIVNPNSGIDIQMLGLRIPNQQLSSNDWMRAIKFYVPIKNSYIYVPHYIVVKVGSDFDIDKLKLYLPTLDNNLKPIEMDDDMPTPRDVTRFKNKSIFSDLEVEVNEDTKLYNVLGKDDVRVSQLMDDILKAWDNLSANNIPLRDENNRDLIENEEFVERILNYNLVTVKDIKVLTEALNNVFIRASFDINGDAMAISYDDLQDLNDLLDELEKLQERIDNTLVLPADMEKMQTRLKQFAGNSIKWSSVDALHNRILEIERDILLNPFNFANLVKPISMETATAVAEEHGINDKVNVRNLSKTVDPLANMENAIYFVHAKLGVGRVALTMNIKAVSLDLGIDLSSKVYNATEDRMIQLHNLFSPNTKVTFAYLVDNNGTITLDHSSETLTLQVDAVKNPISVHLGMNLQTLNLIGYLINIGVSFENIIGLFQTPVVGQYLQELKVRTSKYIGATNGFVSKTDIKQEFFDKWIANTRKSLGSRASEFTKFANSLTSEDDDYHLSYKDVQVLHESMTGPGLGSLESRSNDPLARAKQELVMLMYMFDLIPTGDEFTDFLLAAAPDTRTHKSIESAERMQSSINNYLTQSFTMPKIVTASDFKKIMQNSIVGSFFEAQREYIELIKPLYKLDTLTVKVGNTDVPIFAELREMFRSMTPIGSTAEDVQKYEDSFINDLIIYLTYRILEDAISPTHTLGIKSSEFSANILAVAKQFLQSNEPTLPTNVLAKKINRSGVNVGVSKITPRDPRNRILLEKKVSIQGKELRVARMVDRTLPNVEIEDMIASIKEQLNDIGNTDNVQAALSLFFISTMQSGINNSPYSFNKVLPYSGAIKEIIIKSMQLIEQLSDEHKIQLAKEYFDWFLRANPYVNGNASRQRRNIRFNRLVSPYVWSIKNGQFFLTDSRTNTNINSEILGSSFHKDFTVRGNPTVIESLFNAYMSTKGIVVGGNTSTVTPVISGIVTTGIIGPSSAALKVANQFNIKPSGFSHPQGFVAPNRITPAKLLNAGLQVGTDKFIEENIDLADAVIYITADAKSAGNNKYSAMTTTKKKPYLLIDTRKGQDAALSLLENFIKTNKTSSPFFMGDENREAETFTQTLLTRLLTTLKECAE